MSFLLSLFGGGVFTRIALFISAVLLIVAATFATVKWLEVSRLQKSIEVLQEEKNKVLIDNKILIENNQVLKRNIQQLDAAVASNKRTIEALLAERNAAQEAIKALAASAKRDRAKLNAASSKVEEMASDPKNDGEIAPVLRETIREIQKQRSQQ